MMTTNKVLDLISQQLDVIRAALKLDESDTEIENIEALIAEVEIEVECVAVERTRRVLPLGQFGVREHLAKAVLHAVDLDEVIGAEHDLVELDAK